MSEVSNSRKNQNDLSDYYQQREQNMTTRHGREIQSLKRLNKQKMQNQEISHLEDLHRNDKNHEAQLNRKDMQYRRDIETIQRMHRQHQRELRQATGRELQQTRQAYEYNLKNQEQRHDSQLEQVQRSHVENRAHQQSQEQQRMEVLLNRHQQEIKSDRDKSRALRVQQDKDWQALNQKQREQLRSENELQKNNYERKLNKQEVDHRNEVLKLDRNHLQAREIERKKAADALADSRKAAKHSQAETREKYQEAIYSLNDQYTQQLGKFEQRVDDLNKEITAKERQGTHQQVREQRALQRMIKQKEIEKENQRQADKFAFDTALAERQGMVREFNEIHGRELVNAQKYADQRIADNTRRMDEKVAKESREMQEKMADQHRVAEETRVKQKNQSVRELKTFRKHFGHEQQRMQMAHQTQKGQLKGRYQNHLNALRFKNGQNDQKKMLEFKEHYRNQELRHKQEKAEMQTTHNKAMKDLRLKHLDDFKAYKAKVERAVEAREAALVHEKETQAIRNKRRLESIEEQHLQQVRRLEETQFANMAQLIYSGRKS